MLQKEEPGTIGKSVICKHPHPGHAVFAIILNQNGTISFEDSIIAVEKNLVWKSKGIQRDFVVTSEANQLCLYTYYSSSTHMETLGTALGLEIDLSNANDLSYTSVTNVFHVLCQPAYSHFDLCSCLWTCYNDSKKMFSADEKLLPGMLSLAMVCYYSFLQ